MKIIAHRGGPLIQDLPLPENSLAAIQRSMDAGIKSIEIDVIAAQGKLWISHDRRLGRAISGRGVIANLSLDYLQQQTLENGEPIPQLQSILELVEDKAELNIEIKGQNTIKPVVECLQAWVREHQLNWDQFCISSFDHQQLHQSLTLLPQVRRGVLIEGVPLDYAAICKVLEAFSFNMHLGFVTRELLADSKKRGMQNWVYTVNHLDDARWVRNLGVDAIFTDKPDIMLSL